MSLEIKKLDLHVHTPASHDFVGATVTMAEIVEKAIKSKLDGIAVTDHNSVAAIDEVKQRAKGTKLTIFPGFEISCHGAREGPIHIIGLFDPAKNQVDLERVLGKLDVKGEGNKSLTSKSVTDVVNIINETGGLPVLAHANSTHGALSDIRGNPRIDLVKNPRLLAVEATAGDFQKPQGSRLIDYLNGEDATYRRRLAVYCCSDNPVQSGSGHSVSTIGSNFTYFRMGELTIESLRQCFEDPETRIVQANEKEKLQTELPRILEVSVDGGFLNDQSILFHQGMNSIIGGTGTGKSLLIEFMRFVFNKPPHQDLLKEYNGKLEKQLRDKGMVRIKFVDSSGDEYELTRTYNARKPEESLVTCRNCTTKQKFAGDINSIFPILFYSQNEILEVTRDKGAQLSLLDNFRDFERHRQNIVTLTTELRKLDRQYATNFETAAALPELKKQERTLTEQIRKYDKDLKTKASKKFSDFNSIDQQRTSAIERSATLDVFEEILEGTITDLQKEGEGLADELKTLESPEKDVVTRVNKVFGALVSSVDKALNSIRAEKSDIGAFIKSWDKKTNYAAKKLAYTKFLKTKSKLDVVETQRQKLIGERDKAKRRITDAVRANERISQIGKRRSVLLNQLVNVRSSYFSEREAQAKLITERSNEKLQLQIHKQANNKKYKDNLLKLKVRSYAEDKEIDAIVGGISVIDFVDAILKRDTRSIMSASGITEGKAESIIEVLLRPENLLHTLALQYESFPDDQIEILYRKQDGSYHPLSELSMGQKADALLMIALGDSQMPVIIDQPEDALDVSSIWDDVCQRLRTSKHSRQFIFTTHNSSVAVASDSDQYVIMDANATSGWMSKSGSIDQLDIKDKIIEHLEGGTRSYNLKRKKYNVKSE
ncbi:MAG: TrlF family AAA-like ATPase [Bacteroidota bacterium]